MEQQDRGAALHRAGREEHAWTRSAAPFANPEVPFRPAGRDTDQAKELAEPLRPPELGPMPTEEWLFSLLPMNEKPPGVKPSGCRLR